MAEHQSAREIERDIEHERDELRDTLHEFSNRLTFEDIWDRLGDYVRRQGDLGEGFARVAREKPVALGLTAIGIGLLLFGPTDNPRLRRHRSDGDGSHDPFEREWTHEGEWSGADVDDDRRGLLADAEFADSRASGPVGRAARSDPWHAPHHRDSPDGKAGAHEGGGSTRGISASSRSKSSAAATGSRSPGVDTTPSATGYPEAPSGQSVPKDRTAATPSAPSGSVSRAGTAPKDETGTASPPEPARGGAKASGAQPDAGKGSGGKTDATGSKASPTRKKT